MQHFWEYSYPEDIGIELILAQYYRYGYLVIIKIINIVIDLIIINIFNTFIVMDLS